MAVLQFLRQLLFLKKNKAVLSTDFSMFHKYWIATQRGINMFQGKAEIKNLGSHLEMGSW